MSNMQNCLVVANALGVYAFGALTIVLYGKYSAPFVADILPVVSEIVNTTAITTTTANIDINNLVGLFHENANKIILENNRELFLISYKIMDSFLSPSQISNATSILEVAEQYSYHVFLAIKSDTALYSKLMENDVLVKYIADVIKQGFLNKDIPEALGLKL